MKLKPAQRLSLDVAEDRALTYLKAQKYPVYASQVADAVWLDHSMKAQGAGAAASRILKRLEHRGLVRWRSYAHGWGWVCA